MGKNRLESRTMAGTSTNRSEPKLRSSCSSHGGLKRSPLCRWQTQVRAISEKESHLSEQILLLQNWGWLEEQSDSLRPCHSAGREGGWPNCEAPHLLAAYRTSDSAWIGSDALFSTAGHSKRYRRRPSLSSRDRLQARHDPPHCFTVDSSQKRLLVRRDIEHRLRPAV